ncbi:hypothetical protein C0580_04750 [Candidatus Parcubacteria bacterium]|nr:MAG: hypothetical protein C0580_04750 [Candidatus Parcubacteria bacterium]
MDASRAPLGHDTAQSLSQVVPQDVAGVVLDGLGTDLLRRRTLAAIQQLGTMVPEQGAQELHQLRPLVVRPERTVDVGAVLVDASLVDPLQTDEELALLADQGDLEQRNAAVGLHRQEADVVGRVLGVEQGVVLAVGRRRLDRHLGAEERGLVVVGTVIPLQGDVLGAVDVEAEEAAVTLDRHHDDGVALIGQATDVLPPFGVGDRDRSFAVVEHETNLRSFDDLLGHCPSSS